MREIIINTLVSIVSVVIGWYLSRYQLKPKEIPPAKNIKEAIKRIGKRLIKGVRKNGPLLGSTFIPLYFLISEFTSEDPITRISILKIAIFLFLLSCGFCLNVVLYVTGSQHELLTQLGTAVNVIIEHIRGNVSEPKELEPTKDSLPDKSKQETTNNAATQD